MVKDQTNPKPSIPTNWNQKLEDLFISEKIRKVFDIYKQRIENQMYLSEFIIRITDIDDDGIIDLLLGDFDKCYLLFQEYLFNRLKNELDRDTRKILDDKRFEELHLIIDIEELDLKNREIYDLSIDLTPYLRRLCIFHGKFLNQQIERKIRFLELTYRCSVCGSEWTITNNFRCDRNMKPTGCIKSKCKNRFFDESDVIDKKEIEHGYFTLGDPDIKRFNSNLDCRIFRDISYFYQKASIMNFNEEIRVIGVLRTDHSAIFERGSAKLRNYTYYIEVLDIISDRENKIDEGVIKVLREKLNTRPKYREILIDSLFPFTWMVDVFLPPKICLVLSYISGGSWNEVHNYRDTINTIIGGGGSTFKSSLARNIVSILRDNDVLYHENKKITQAGLIGTTTRNSDGKIEVKFGVLPSYSNGTIIFDEAQELNYDVLSALRCVEKGDVGGIQDSVAFFAPARESIVLIQNFRVKNDGYYDAYHTLFENLSWKEENAKSLLERFDLFCNIDRPDKYVQLWIAENEKKQSDNSLFNEIYESLEMDDYSIPNTIKDKMKQAGYVLRNFLLKAKQIYRNSDIKEEFKDLIREVYIQAIKSGVDVSDDGVDITQRSKNSCYKVLKGLASLRLNSEVNEGDFDYFKLRGINLITSFRNTKLFSKELVDLNAVFVQTLTDLFEKQSNPISIEDHIEYMRSYLKRTIFTVSLDREDLKQNKKTLDKVNELIPETTNLGKNYAYRKLLKANREKLLDDYGINIRYINKKTHYYKKKTMISITKDEEPILEKILVRVNEILETNKGLQLELGSLIQILDLDFDDMNKDQIGAMLLKLIDMEYIDENRISFG